MDRDLQSLKEMWLEFVETGEINQNVKPYIAESWIRSKEYGVDCINGGIVKKLSSEELNRIVYENRDLVLIALPVMQQIMNQVEDIAWISFANQDGYIIEILAKEPFDARRQSLNLYKGVHWCEEEIGTNAISLSLMHNKPIHTIGAEHYCQDHHSGMCAAAPVHDKKGKIIGCLNISCSNDNMRNNIMSLAVIGVSTIEKQVLILHAYELIEKTFNSISEGMIITDNELKIVKVNENAYRILKISEADMIGKDLSEFLKDINLGNILSESTPLYNRDCYFYIENTKIYCKGNINILKQHSKNDGLVLVFNKEKNAHRVANEITGNSAKYTFDNIITKNRAMLELIDFAKKVSKSNCNILILGDSGTGKELFAQSIHNESDRARGPFVAMNCAAIPRDLVESELFGYERGSFTGALNEGLAGKFELANTGTLFLDEIGDMPIEIQSKILRVLDNHQITRIGSKHEKSLDVRVIAATNTDLLSEVNKKNFRLDLYYRLNVVTLNIPSLNERRDDIRLLANHFLQHMNKEEHKTIGRIDEAVLSLFEESEWNGNIRQLQNLIARVFYYCKNDTITVDCLPEYEFDKTKLNVRRTTKNPIQDAEKSLIIDSILNNNGNITKAAKELHISKSTIYRKIERYGIDVDNMAQ